MTWVAGVDGSPTGWVAVLLDDGSFHSAVLLDRFAQLWDAEKQIAVVAVDMPIGFPTGDRPRPADVAAKAYLGTRHPSVFMIPPREVLETTDYSAALERCQQLTGRGLSKQSFSLRRRIFEVDETVAAGPVAETRVVEAHPEVSFRSMAQRPVTSHKRSWHGAEERRGLLRSNGIRVPTDLGDAGSAAIDDVLDAAACAWTARRVDLGHARTLPDDPPVDERGRPVAIWH